MKTIVIVAGHPEPARLLADDRLASVRALMGAGAFGRLVGVAATDRSSPWDVPNSVEAPAAPGIPAGIPGLASLLGAGPGETILIDARQDNGPRPTPTIPGPSREIHPDPDPVARSRSRFAMLRRLAGSRDWSYAQLVDPGPVLATETGEVAAAAWEEMLDGELGLLLAGIEGEVTCLLVVMPDRDREGDAGPVVPDGVFILASSRGVALGEFEGVRSGDLAPTLLLLAGHAIPETMGGIPIEPREFGTIGEEDELALDRLRGLGYIDEWGP